MYKGVSGDSQGGSEESNTFQPVSSASKRVLRAFKWISGDFKGGYWVFQEVSEYFRRFQGRFRDVLIVSGEFYEI